MDTGARLKEQRKSQASRYGGVFGMGLGLGLVLGFFVAALTDMEMNTTFFYFIGSFGLGILATLLYRHITGLRKKSLEETG